MTQSLLAAVVLLLMACSGKSDGVKHTGHESGVHTETLYVVNHGWHTGLVVPAREIQSRLSQLRDRFENTPYLEVGWGDRGFYQAKEITVGLAVRAILWPTEAVVHVVAVPARVEAYFPNSPVRTLCLRRDEYDALIDFIADSFLRDEAGRAVAMGNGIYGDSQFYRATGTYHLLNTCNTWTARGLERAGFDISPTFKLTAGSIMAYLARQQQETGSCIRTGAPHSSSPVTLVE